MRERQIAAALALMVLIFSARMLYDLWPELAGAKKLLAVGAFIALFASVTATILRFMGLL